MSVEPFLGEIQLFPYEFAPKGWAFCEGQLLSVAQNQALFSLLGTYYGGNGSTTFALPDLRGRAPVHVGNSIQLGQKGGEEAHIVTVNEMPSHTHQAKSITETGGSLSPKDAVWAGNTSTDTYSSNINVLMNSSALSTTGGNQAHPNMQPYIVLNYCIALQGIYPTRN